MKVIKQKKHTYRKEDLNRLYLIKTGEEIVVKSHYRSHEIGLWNNKLAEYVREHPNSKTRTNSLADMTITDPVENEQDDDEDNLDHDVEIYPGRDYHPDDEDDDRDGPTVLIAGDPGRNGVGGGTGGDGTTWISFRCVLNKYVRCNTIK